MCGSRAVGAGHGILQRADRTGKFTDLLDTSFHSFLFLLKQGFKKEGGGGEGKAREL